MNLQHAVRALPLAAIALLFACSQDTPPSATRTAAPVEPAPAPAPAATPDLIVTNGVVYTVDAAQPEAQAFAIKDGKFIAVGSNEAVSALAGDDTATLDAGGKFILPGFIDTHFHSVAASIITADPTEQSYYQRDEKGEPTGFIEEIPAYFGVYFPIIGEISEQWLEEKVGKAFPTFSRQGARQPDPRDDDRPGRHAALQPGPVRGQL
jgi:hypothetical protein